MVGLRAARVALRFRNVKLRPLSGASSCR